MNFTDLQTELFLKERNIYEAADLYEQNRLTVAEMLPDLAAPESGNEKLKTSEKGVESSSGITYPVRNEVIDFCLNEFEKSNDEWARQNKQFLNYHKSLSVYTLVNSLPILNYLGEKSGIANFKDGTVIDVGAGTGHAYCSLFRYPETIRYYLCDPNLRLLHDQFLRVFPNLARLKLGHVLCYAEKLPFRSDCADLVMSLSSIDHFKSYEDFFAESFRVLKKGGRIFLSSHLDLPPSERIQKTKAASKLFSYSFWERLARYLYFRRYRVGSDDHTWHFETTEPLEEALIKKGFRIQEKEVFYGHFWILAIKD